MQPDDPLPLLPLAWAVLRQLLALALLAVAAAGAGHLLTGGLATASRREALAVATATGLGVLGSALFVLGLAGGLRRWVVLALLAMAGAAGVRALAAIRRTRGVESGEGESGTGAARRFRPAPRMAALALALAVLPTFVWSLFPPTGFDATTYHLPYVRAFAAAQRLVVVPDVIFPIFPQLGEALFTAVLLATGADMTTHVVQLLALGVVALLLDAAGRRFFSPAAGLWAAALWLAHPLAHYQAASAYVDLLLALFCLLAVHAWEAWREGRGARDRRGGGEVLAGRGWLILSGAACGFAAAVKYLGLLWLGVLGLVTLAWAPRRRRRPMVRPHPPPHRQPGPPAPRIAVRRGGGGVGDGRHRRHRRRRLGLVHERRRGAGRRHRPRAGPPGGGSAASPGGRASTAAGSAASRRWPRGTSCWCRWRRRSGCATGGCCAGCCWWPSTRCCGPPTTRASSFPAWRCWPSSAAARCTTWAGGSRDLGSG